MIGTRLAHYDIVEEISRGGMGVVYRAVDANLGREVALKVLPEDLAHDPERRARLLQEARAASALEHPHIAVIHEVGEAGGVTFIAMELIRGEKLSDTLARGPLAPARALTLAIEIAEALARAHERGIVHRDVKPANVMVTEDGHTKVIDFGLAKPLGPAADATVSAGAPGTAPGMVLGTAAYMAPEQARGLRVDHRSDVFALGVTLYEMLAGRPAFGGPSSLDTLQAVLTRPVPPLPAAIGLPADVSAELQRIIAKATAKDADDRFQSMKDLIVDLRAARRRLESAEHDAAAAPAARRPRRAAGPAARRWAVALIGGAIAGLAAWWWSARPARPPAASPSGKPVVAVLYFENNTGDRALDWMRTGLTDMIVTDLSESPDFEVLGTDRLVQILQELEWPHDRPISADVVEAIAERAAVDRVLLGSYVKAGGTIRISARLQEARSGRIVSAERVEGQGEVSLFGLVDELTRRVRTHLTAGRPGPPASLVERPGEASRETGLDRGLAEITTSSIEAYRYYAEGLNFHERDLPEQALPLLEKAVAVDPDFAMAYAKLAVVQNNLRAWDKRDEYARKALALTSRLTTRERYYIEGFYYSNYPETLARGIEAYRQGLKLHPEHQASRHNLGLIFILLERFPEALEQYEELVRRRVSTPTTYENLAELLVQTGDTGRAREVADDFLGRYPDSASGLRMLGATLVAAGRLEEARAAFEKAEALNPLDVGARIGRRAVALLQQRWEDVHAISDELARSPSPFSRFQSLLGEALVAQAHGRSRIALETLERAARVPGLAHQQRAVARNRMAESLLRSGWPAAALAQAERALADARRRDAEFRTLHLIAIAHAALGHAGEAAKALAQLEERAGVLPSRREIRRVHWTRGQIALERGDAAGAVAELDQAVSMLPPHGPPIGPPSSHVDLWYDAALARIRVGRDADAAPLLERIQSGHERALATDAWARSFFLLGQIAERRGDRARAREQYARFLELWRDGDLERAWVAEAARKLSAAGRPTADTRLPDAGPPRP